MNMTMNMNSETKTFSHVVPSWTRFTLTPEIFRTLHSIQHLTRYLQQITKKNIEMMYIDGEFDTCVIRSAFEFQMWQSWNQSLSPHSEIWIWYRSVSDEKTDIERSNSTCLLCDLEDAPCSIATKITTKPDKTETTTLPTFKILAAHALAVVESEPNSYILKQRWTLQNIGKDWNPYDNNICFMSLTLPQQQILSVSLPTRCLSKQNCYMHVVFRCYKGSDEERESKLNDTKQTLKTYYFQLAKRVIMFNKHGKEQQQTHVPFGPRFPVIINEKHLANTVLIENAIDQLVLLKHDTSRSKWRLVCFSILREKHHIDTAEQLVCYALDFKK